jgi:hypothetical protein
MFGMELPILFFTASIPADPKHFFLLSIRYDLTLHKIRSHMHILRSAASFIAAIY